MSSSDSASTICNRNRNPARPSKWMALSDRGGGRLCHGHAVCLFVLVVGCGCGQKTMIYSRLMHVIADDYSFILYQNVHKATLSRVYYYQMESMNS